MHSDMTEVMDPEREHLESVVRWPEAFRGDESASIWGSSFFQRDAPGRCREVPDALNLETYRPWGTSVGDLNAAGCEDLFITVGMSYPFRYMRNSALNHAPTAWRLLGSTGRVRRGPIPSRRGRRNRKRHRMQPR